VLELFRVFPFTPDAHPDEPGGALFVPPQGGGRIDNPDLYSVLYASSAAAGAVAEAFGRFPEWTPAILAGSPALPGSSRAIARYQLGESARLCDLDDPAQLAALGLRPSDVVSRDYSRTRGWARLIHHQGTWSGVRWWSYYDPRWSSIGLWRREGLVPAEVRVLRLEDAAVVEAARTIARRIVIRG
jgi:RES domain